MSSAERSPLLEIDCLKSRSPLRKCGFAEVTNLSNIATAMLSLQRGKSDNQPEICTGRFGQNADMEHGLVGNPPSPPTQWRTALAKEASSCLLPTAALVLSLIVSITFP